MRLNKREKNRIVLGFKKFVPSDAHIVTHLPSQLYDLHPRFMALVNPCPSQIRASLWLE